MNLFLLRFDRKDGTQIMKKMVCEICGSNDIEKKDGVFVCKSCGTQYSTEEAKKLLIEVSGNVEVSGSVKVDNSERLENLYSNARRARDAANFAEAAKYYDYILMEDPNSWEANFFSVYCKAFSCKIAQIGAYAILVANSFPEVLRLIKDDVPESDWNSTVKKITTLLDALYRELIKGSYDFYKPYSDFAAIAQDGFKCCDGSATCGDAIYSAFSGNQTVQKNAVTLWNTCIFLCDGLIELRPSKIDPYTLSWESRQSYRKKMEKYQEKVFRVSDPDGYRKRKEEQAERERVRREEQAERERKEREAYEASQPKTEEERLQRLIYDDKSLLWFMGGLILIGIGVGFIAYWITTYQEFPPIGFCLALSPCILVGAIGLWFGIDGLKVVRGYKKQLKIIKKLSKQEENKNGLLGFIEQQEKEMEIYKKQYERGELTADEYIALINDIERKIKEASSDSN